MFHLPNQLVELRNYASGFLNEWYHIGVTPTVKLNSNIEFYGFLITDPALYYYHVHVPKKRTHRVMVMNRYASMRYKAPALSIDLYIWFLKWFPTHFVAHWDAYNRPIVRIVSPPNSISV